MNDLKAVKGGKGDSHSACVQRCELAGDDQQAKGRQALWFRTSWKDVQLTASWIIDPNKPDKMTPSFARCSKLASDGMFVPLRLKGLSFAARLRCCASIETDSH